MPERIRQNIFQLIIMTCGLLIMGHQTALATDMPGKVTAVSGEQITIRLNEGWIPDKGDKVNFSRNHPALGTISVGEAVITDVDGAPVVTAKKSSGEAEITIGTDAVVSSQSDRRVKVKAEIIRHPDPINKKSGWDLLAAMEKNDVGAVKKALARGANVNAALEGFETALITASARGNKALVRLLLASGADPHMESVEEGHTALNSAARAGHTDVVDMLLAAGVDVDARGSSREDDFFSLTPAISYAADGNQAPMITHLIGRGANPNLENELGVPALFFAAQNGNIDVVNALLNAGVLLDQASSSGITPLMATTGGKWQLTAYILAAGANPDQQITKAGAALNPDAPGMTSLMLSILENKRDVFFTLLLGGAKTDIKRHDGKTAFDLASDMLKNGEPDTSRYENMELMQKALLHPKWGQKKAVEAIAYELEDEIEDNNFVIVSAAMRLGLDPNVMVDDAPLFFAAVDSGNMSIVNLLLKHGADPNVKDKEGYTAFYKALFRGNAAVTKRLVEKGADPNILPQGRDETPLHEAAEGGYVTELKILLDAGVRPDIRDEDQETPLHKAADDGELETFSLLLKAGANPALKNIDGETPLDLVHSSKKADFQAALRKAGY